MGDRVLTGRKLKYPVEDKNLGHFFFNNAEKHNDKICWIDGTIDKIETFSSVKQRSTRVAIALQNRGITSSDVIAICSSNTLDVGIPIIATFYLGAKVANLEPSLSVRHTKHLLSLVSPKIVFVEEHSVPLIEESLKDTNLQAEVIVLGQSKKYSVFADLVTPQTDEEKFRPSDTDVNEVAVMFFSSGTTGLPKAICHSSYTALYIINQTYQLSTWNASLHFSTFYWMTAMMLLTYSFKCGSYRVFCRNPSAKDIFRIIEKYKVARMFMAPVLTYQLTDFPDFKKYDTSSLKLIMVAGAPIAPAQSERIRNLFKNTILIIGYGMSEIGFVTSFDQKLDRELIQKKTDSCGKPAPGLSLKVVVPNTAQLLGPNQTGEICIASPSMMKGYYKADSSHVFDEEGFLKTGDVGYYDDEGCVYLNGRLKEMIKYQSWQLVPSFIEAALLEHPAVKEAVVFGIPHEVHGEIPAACIVLKDNVNTSEEEIRKFLESRVTDREKLRGGVTFLKELPKTPTGKPMRKEIRDSFIRRSSTFWISQ